MCAYICFICIPNTADSLDYLKVKEIGSDMKPGDWSLCFFNCPHCVLLGLLLPVSCFRSSTSQPDISLTVTFTSVDQKLDNHSYKQVED